MSLILTGIAAFAIVALVGWIVKRIVIPALQQHSSYHFALWHLSVREYAIGLTVFGLVVVPATMTAGNSLSVSSSLRYQEFYDGVEFEPELLVKTCTPGTSGNDASSGQSNCHYQYDTGRNYSYTVMVTETYQCTGADDKPSTCTHRVPKTRWANIYYPRTHKELTYEISNSLGETYRFSTVYIHPDAKPYDGKPIPSNIPRGAPEKWLESKQRFDAGDPRSVTGIYTYNNPVLAAQDELYLPFSQDVDRYVAADLLPDHTANIMDNPLTGFDGAFAHKLSFVGVSVDDEEAWQESVMGFNGALGSKLRGDLHMVVIDSALVDSPTKYLNALKAYWVSDHFGRRAIAKNAIIVVVGVQGTSVQWTKATTGMPFGNETMLQGIEDNLHDVELTPEVVIGNPRTIVTPATVEGEDDKVDVYLAEKPGVLEQVVLQDFPFKRACMQCKDEDDEGIGYEHLVAKIPPKPAHLFLMGLVIFIISLGFWLFAGVTTLMDGRWIERTPQDSPIPSKKYRVRLRGGKERA